MSEQTFYYGVTQNLSANTFEREGYTFEGWTLVSDGKSVYSDKESISDVATDTTLYAVWFYGSVVTATTVSELDLTNLTEAYTIKVTGNITQSDLVALAGKMANATADITLDLSETNLTTISSTSDSKSIFASCTKLTEIVLPETMTTIGSYAFYRTGLKNITIPKNIRIIRERTFERCTNLENVFYEGTMEEWREIEIVHGKHEIEFGKLISGTPIHEILSERLIPIPGNEALLSAAIHFRCELEKTQQPTTFQIKMAGKEVTDLFRTV